ncbi:MAG: DNA polymerase IV [Candidatus Heimdallarchaeota archaeon]|nr:DNA polymerase IV [Candidatus Heimdallarchaeota archaeon]MCK5048825.1 DNA polymerase IV [Candidatus Heimdallarchaeota archaeon]
MSRTSPFEHQQFHLSELNDDEVTQEDRIILHLDLDMFYAAVEIKNDPTLKGKPLIVGNPSARQNGRGVVLTCSYEARKFGVHSGMPMRTALEKCPQAEISNKARKEYMPTSERIMETLKDLEEPISLMGSDEAYIDITALVTNYEAAYIVAKELQTKIFKQEELTCSIGIGPTLKVAKIASDFNKPNGITVVKPEGLEKLFNDLPLRKIPGIGRASAQKLAERGFLTCDQLMDKSIYELEKLVGFYASYLYDIFRGKSRNVIRPREGRKSISHSSTFYAEVGDTVKYKEIFDHLFDKTYEKLVEKSFETRTINIRIRFKGYKTITVAHSFKIPIQQRDLLYETGLDIAQKHFSNRKGIRLIGVGFSNLELTELHQTMISDFF